VKRPGFFRSCLTLAGKDLLLERRTWESLSSSLVFCVIVMVIFSFAFGFAAARELGVDKLVPGVMWIVIAFGAIVGLTRSMQLERRQGTLAAILLAPVDRTAIFIGKLTSNLIQLLMLQVIVAPLAALFFDYDLFSIFPELFFVLLLHGFGLTAVGTLFAAVASRVGRGEALLATLLFPATAPLFISAVKCTASLLQGRGLEPVRDWLLVSGGFDVLYLLVALSTFEFVLEE